MKQVLISGYLGFNNYGDEALLFVIIKNLLGLGVRRENITVISNDVPLTSGNYKVNAVNRWNLFSVIDSITKNDLLIFIGGVFQDKTSFKSFLFYFFQLFMAGLLGKKVLLLGAGIGPFQRRISQVLFNFGVGNIDLISVRDQGSAELIPHKNNVLTTCDLVWGVEFDDSFKKSVKGINWNVPILGISLRQDRYLKTPQMSAFAEKLSRIVNGMKDWQIILIPCMKEDLGILYELYDIISKKVSELNRIIILENFTDLPIQQQIGIMSNCNAIIGMRYHALLTALSNQKPVFGLIYDQKVKALVEFASQVGISFKDDLEQPWNYFWQNLQYSEEKAKLSREKAIQLNKINIDVLIKCLA